MKILHVVGDSKFGGGSVIIMGLAEKAVELGWEVNVLTSDAQYINILNSKNINTINSNFIRRSIHPIHDSLGVYQLYRFLRKNHYDIVHTHTSKGGFIGRLAARMAGVPVVIHTAHGFAFHEETVKPVLYFFSQLERLAAYWADVVVTVSNFHRQWALKLKIGNEKKVKAIPNGINPARVMLRKDCDQVRKELGVQTDEIVIMVLGRLAKQKGLEDLLESVPQILQQSASKFRILLVGEGPLEAELEQLTQQLNISEYILFLGFRDDIGDLLAATDIVVLPTLREGLSIALLEAMSAAKPVITTTIGSNKEVIVDGISGLLVPPKCPDRIAEAIVNLMENDQLRKSLGSEAKKKFEQYYTEDRMLQSYMELYLSFFN